MKYFPLRLEHIQGPPVYEHSEVIRYDIHGTLMGRPIIVTLTTTPGKLHIQIYHYPDIPHILQYDDTTHTPYICPHKDILFDTYRVKIFNDISVTGDYTCLNDMYTHKQLDAIHTILQDILNTLADPIHLHRIIVWTLLVYAMARFHNIHPNSLYTLWPGRKELSHHYGTQCIYPYQHKGHNIIYPEDTQTPVQSGWTASFVAGSNSMIEHWNTLYRHDTTTHCPVATIAALCAAAKPLDIPLDHPLLAGINFDNVEPYDITPVLLSMHAHTHTTRHTTRHLHPNIHQDTPLPIIHQATHRTYDKPDMHRQFHDGWMHGMPVSITHTYYGLRHTCYKITEVAMLYPTILPTWDIITHRPQSTINAYTGHDIVDVKQEKKIPPRQYLPGYNPGDDVFPLYTRIHHANRLDSIIAVLIYLVLHDVIPKPTNKYKGSPVIDTIRYINEDDTDWSVNTHEGKRVLWPNMHATLTWAGIPTMHYNTHKNVWQKKEIDHILYRHLYDTFTSMSQHDTIALNRTIHTISDTGIPTLPIDIQRPA